MFNLHSIIGRDRALALTDNDGSVCTIPFVEDYASMPKFASLKMYGTINQNFICLTFERNGAEARLGVDSFKEVLTIDGSRGVEIAPREVLPIGGEEVHKGDQAAPRL